MANYFNITNDLTQELLAAGSNVNVSSISFTNVGTLTCTVDLYIEKQLTGKFYILKTTPLFVGNTFVHDFTFDNSANEFGLFLKLNKVAGITPTVDVIIK